MSNLTGMLPMVFMFVVLYFMMIRPQMKRSKEHKALLEGLQKNDEVMTQAGIVGKVTRVDEDYVDVEIAQGVKVKVVKATLSDIMQPGGKPAND